MTVTARPPNPCPYCGRSYSMAYRAALGVSEGTHIRIRDIEDHDCPAFRQEPTTDTVIPFVASIADHRNTVYGMERYRRGIR